MDTQASAITVTLRYRVASVAALGLIFFVFFILFYRARITQVSDSHYSMLLGETIWSEHSFALDNHFHVPLDPVKYPAYDPVSGLPRTVTRESGHTYYIYPYGSSVLSSPFIAILNKFGISASAADGSYNIDGEVRIQRILSAALMAGWSCLLFMICRMFLTPLWGLLLTIALNLGSPILSTASRGMWSHTWSVFLTGLLVFVMAKSAKKGAPPNPYIVGSLLSLAYFVRPSNGLQALIVFGYIAILYRKLVIPLALTGAAWVIALIALSMAVFHTPVPVYARTVVGLMHLNAKYFLALAGLVISPSRGILVFMPVLGLVAFLTVRYWKSLECPGLVKLCIVMVFMHLLTISAFLEWWAGHSYGPRYMTDVLPWASLLSVITFAAWGSQIRATALAGHAPRAALYRRSVLLFAISVWGIAVNAVGACSYSAASWNAFPTDINLDRQKVWSLANPQFLAWRSVPKPAKSTTTLAVAATKTVESPTGSQTSLLAGERLAVFEMSDRGLSNSLAGFWHDADGPCRWSVDTRADFKFAAKRPLADKLVVEVAYSLINSDQTEQRLELILNGASVYRGEIRSAQRFVAVAPLTSGLLRAENRLEFVLPDAKTPRQLNLSEDDRKLGICVQRISLIQSK